MQFGDIFEVTIQICVVSPQKVKKYLSVGQSRKSTYVHLKIYKYLNLLIIYRYTDFYKLMIFFIFL